jgi:hypothetical protein
MPGLIQSLGAVCVFLAIWIALLDVRNQFLPTLVVAAILLLGVGSILERINSID